MDLTETVHALAALGYKTAAITEHKYHFMHDPVQYEQYLLAVKGLQKKTPMTLLPGMEICVLKDDIDWAPHFVKGKFIVLASVHEKMPSQEEFLKRTICTIKDPRVHIIGHPLRVLIQSKLAPLSRAQQQNIFDAILEEYKKNHPITLEINSGDYRHGFMNNDFYENFYKSALAAGVKFSLGTDAHQQEELKSIPWDFFEKIGVTEKNFFTPQLP